MLTLYIGNKNYSSWSMRPWVLMRQAGIAFEEVMVRFDSFEADSQFKARLAGITPAGKVPTLVDDGFAVWDSLAIAEYLAERFPDKHLWPQDAQQRARARSLCAQMHSGFTALRSHCPMNIEAVLHDKGQRIWQEQEGVRQDLARIIEMWTQQLSAQPRGPGLLFGEFSIADAFFAPVCMRIRTYGLPVPGLVSDYIARVVALPGVQAWIDQGLAEHDFIAFNEPYRKAP